MNSLMFLSAIALFGLIAISNARPNVIAPHNVVVVPPNCPPGQVLVNGQCRDVWRLVPAPIILPKPLVPTVAQDTDNTPWDFVQALEQRSNEELAQEHEPKGIITIPNQCPIGYRPDAHGICRKIF